MQPSVLSRTETVNPHHVTGGNDHGDDRTRTAVRLFRDHRRPDVHLGPVRHCPADHEPRRHRQRGSLAGEGEPARALRPAHGGRQLEQPAARPGVVRGGRPDHAEADRHRPGAGRHDRRSLDPHDQQPDLRPDRHQQGGRERGAAALDGRHVPAAHRGGHGTARRERHLLHPQRVARHRSVAPVQRRDDPVRAVLRPRPRPDHQGRQQHRVRAADAGRPALRQPGLGPPGLSPTEQLHDPDARHGRSGTRRATGDGGRRPRQHDDLLRRPEPDLHLPRVAPGLPARLLARRQHDLLHRPAAGRRIRCGELGRGQGTGRGDAGYRADGQGRAQRAAAGDGRLRPVHPRPERVRPAGDGSRRDAHGLLAEGRHGGGHLHRRLAQDKPRFPGRHRARRGAERRPRQRHRRERPGRPHRRLRQRDAGPPLHHRGRPRQREHRPDRHPHRLPLGAQPAGRAVQADTGRRRRRQGGRDLPKPSRAPTARPWPTTTSA